MKLDINKKEQELIKRRILDSQLEIKETWVDKLKSKLLKNKSKRKTIRKTTLDILPYKGTIGEKEHFIVADNKFIDILAYSGVNFDAMSNHGKWALIKDYESLMMLYVSPFKEISMYMPMETTETQRYYLELAKRQSNPIHKQICMENYYVMKWLEENKANKEFFVCIYGDTVQELRENRNDFLNYCGNIKVLPITRRKKKSVYFRMNNPTSTILFNS